ncbi:hypothetical protein FJY84_00355 [Candidatus Bathyarchaeota archaeon]|nr:hypothetical protein [Candidatus Bathyarchaeota archaeon]
MLKKQKRGYLLTILIHFDMKETQIWDVFTESIKPFKILKNDSNIYTNFENIINSIKIKLKSGINSVIILQKQKDSMPKNFLEHVNKHYKWLISGNKRIFIKIFETGFKDQENISLLHKNQKFEEILSDILKEETSQISEFLEKAINENKIFYDIIEIKKIIKNRENFSGFLLISEKIDLANKNDRDYKSITQLSKNKGIKIKIFNSNIIFSQRIEKLGGIILIENSFL